MILSARILRDVANVNVWRPASGPYEMVENDGDGVVYLQLVDQTLDLPSEGYVPPYRRYVAASGATLSIRFESLDSARVITRSATRPYALDGSIWQVQVLAADALRGTVGWLLTLTESSVVHTGRLQPAMCVRSKGLVR